MYIVLPTYPGDFDRAMNLADWLLEVLSDYTRHNALVVGGAGLDNSELFQLGEKIKLAGFKHVTTIRQKSEDSSDWPMAPNAMWRLAASWMKDFGLTPWLWIEPDAVPIVPGWLDRITDEYQNAHKPFMGYVYGQPFDHLNGVCIYPPNVLRYNRLMFNSEFFQRPFDTVRPDLVLPFTHRSKLFWRGLEDTGTNTPMTFPDIESLQAIPADCVLAHCCKDGTLIQRLRELRNPGEPVEHRVSLGQRLMDGVRRIVGVNGPMYHSGNLGDVIYSLAAIKAYGGEDLIIGPEQRKTAVCALPIDKKQFEMFEPLLRSQEYLKSVSYSEKYPASCRDLNHFRSVWINRTLCRKHGIDTLAKAHYYELNLLNKFEDSETWLTCGEPIATGKMICHRSPRYNSPSVGTQSFLWQRLVDKYHAEMIFVGLESEHDTFCRNFGKKVSFYRVSDFEEMARLIKGGRCMVANQSFPLSIAIGLGQTVYVEELPRSPDCRFNRDNFYSQLLGNIDL